LDAENELMMEAFNGVYLIRVDVDEWGWDDLPLFGDIEAIPVFYRLDADGQPTGDTIDGNAWGANIPENMAPPLKEFFQSQ
jgi:hypothetical protein